MVKGLWDKIRDFWRENNGDPNAEKVLVACSRCGHPTEAPKMPPGEGQTQFCEECLSGRRKVFNEYKCPCGHRQSKPVPRGVVSIIMCRCEVCRERLSDKHIVTDRDGG